MATFKFVNDNVRIEAHDNYFFVRNYAKAQNAPADGIIENNKKFIKFVSALESANFNEKTTWSEVMEVVLSVKNTKKNISYTI